MAGTTRAAGTALLACLTLIALAPLESARAAPAEGARRELVVGTYVDPPFVMKDERGEWRGAAIGLWSEVARREGLTFRLVEYELEELLGAVAAGRVDVAVGPLLVTAERERRLDMTSPFLQVALAIATRPVESSTWWTSLVSSAGTIGKAALGLVATMVLFALVVWLVERRRNPDHFGGDRLKGIGDAVWWSASTMTTVGYGDRIPITLWGRAIGILWMILSIVLVSTFIATVSSTLTLARLKPEIRSLHDLARVRVGVVEGSGAAELVAAMHLPAVQYPEVETALATLARGEIDAVVDEEPVLRYLATNQYGGHLSVLAQPFNEGFVGFALPLGSPLLRSVNVTLLDVLDDPAWEDLRRVYLGG